MSMSTQHGGGTRRPSTRPVAGAKRKQGGDKEPEAAVDLDAETASVTEDSASDLEDSSPSSSDASEGPDDDESDAAEEQPAAKPKTKASPRKSAPVRKPGTAGAKKAG